MEAVQYKCPNCGGELVFDAATQKFTCAFCLDSFTEQQIEERYKQQNQQAHENADTSAQTLQNENDSSAFEEQTRLYECGSCGAQIIADETTSATFCYYCHNPVILAGRLSKEFQPKYVMPFHVTKEEAEAAFKAWCRKRWFLPRSFTSKKQLEKMSGVYVPFWLADCKADSTLNAVGEQRRSWRSGNYEITEIKEFAIERSATLPFEKLPADGAKKIEDALMDAIEPFPYKQLRPFSMQYLSGFMAEKYDVGKEEVRPRIEERIRQAADSILMESVNGYSIVKNKRMNVNMQQLRQDYALLPVWFMTYHYKGKIYSFAMNGQTKKLSGTPPLSWGKLLGFCFGLMLLVTLIIGLIGGAILC